MPTSRRDKKVDLTKVRKKAPKKKEHVEKVRKLLDSFSRAYVVKFHNPRNNKICEIRRELKNIQLIFGKNKVNTVALSANKTNADKPRLDKLSRYLKGQCALLLSNLPPSELREQLDAFRSQEYSRPGVAASQTVHLASGELYKFTHTMEPLLRQLGLPVKLVRGVIHLERDHLVCRQGDILTPDQCKILKLFNLEMSEFRVGLVASWTQEDGVEELEQSDAFEMRTSLAPEVRVVCKKLDDGLFYFIPEPYESPTEDQAVEPEEMETEED